MQLIKTAFDYLNSKEAKVRAQGDWIISRFQNDMEIKRYSDYEFRFDEFDMEERMANYGFTGRVKACEGGVERDSTMVQLDEYEAEVMEYVKKNWKAERANYSAYSLHNFTCTVAKVLGVPKTVKYDNGTLTLTRKVTGEATFSMVFNKLPEDILEGLVSRGVKEIVRESATLQRRRMLKGREVFPFKVDL